MAVQGLAMGDAVPDEDLPTNEVPDSDLPDTNPTTDQAVPEFSEKTKDVLGGATELAGSAIGNIPHAAAHGVQDLYRRLTGGNPDSPDNAFVRSLEVPVGDRGKKLAQNISAALPKRNNLPNQPDDTAIPEFNDTTRDVIGNTLDVAGDVGSIASAAGILSKAVPATKNAILASRAASEATAPAAPTFTPEEAVKNTTASGSMGAAGSAPDLSVAPPALKTAISQAAQKTGGAVHPVALDRHLDAAQLPLPEGSEPLWLRKGQATDDAQQISDEKNLRADPDTHGILSDSIEDQDTKLRQSIGEIRRRATPDIVQRDNTEHGQSAVDSIKNQDNKTVLDMRAKYQALADANGGDMPIDAGTTINNINARLKKGSLRNTAADNGVISEIIGNLSSGEPMDFETFDNARSRLAEVQRGGGSDSVAAGIVHDELNNMPLTPEAAPLRDLADTARAAAKARFDTIKYNPAYKAAVTDNVPKDNKGLHIVGQDSPLASTFMDRFALGNGPTASPAYIQGLKESVPDASLHQSIEAATLNKLRDAAGVDANGNGSFRNASYSNAVNSISQKSKALLSPESIENTDRLKRVSGYVNNESKASSTNRSNTMLALQRFGAVGTEVPSTAAGLVSHGLDAAGDLAAGHLAGPVGIGAKHLTQGILKGKSEAKALQAMKDAKLKFAMDATKPGAGLDHLPTAPPRPQRASGGKVDHEHLVERLMSRWKAAKRETDKTTKPLLNVSDNTIARALQIAGDAL
jgi:hypothetical protein